MNKELRVECIKTLLNEGFTFLIPSQSEENIEIFALNNPEYRVLEFIPSIENNKLLDIYGKIS